MPSLRVRQVMERKGVSLRELARRLRRDVTNTARQVKDDANPTLSTLAAVAKALKCKVRDLIKE